MSKAICGSVFGLSYLTFFFTGVGFNFSILEQVAAGVISLAFLFFAAKRGKQVFFVTALTSITTALSLGVTFLHHAEASGPFVIEAVLNPWLIIFFAMLAGGLAWFYEEQGRSPNTFAWILTAVFIFNWVILAFNVRFYEDWKTENWLTVPFAILIIIGHRWFKFSNISYGLIFIFMMLHIYGAHYTYAEVPFGYWLQNVFEMSRNHYDRIVHWSFGFLFAYPIREVVVRVSNTKGFWAYWFPIEFVLAFSCLYELMEWAVAVVFGGDLGIAYLGSQGDVWDAQKDMFNAGIGAIIAMLIVAFIVWYYRRNKFWSEIKESFAVKHAVPLGEEALRRFK
jgi:putative membrane protein